MTTFQTNFSEINWSAVGKTGELGPNVREHVKKVYTCLFGTILSAALGSAFYSQYHLIGGMGSMLLGFGLLLWLGVTPKEESEKRMALLAGFGFVEGLSLGPLLEAAMDVDPSIVGTAFICTAVVFGCFSATAFYAQRRSYLYLGGMLSSGLSLLLTLSLLNIFFRSSAAVMFSVYFGLMLFCGFIIFDTQLMIERAENGNSDFVWDALTLFLDAVNVFVRIIVILTKNKKNERK